MPLASLLDFWKRDAETAPNLVAWRTLPSRPAQTHPFPSDLPAPVQQTLIAAGIHSLYSHQLEAWTQAAPDRNIILSTGTASGKTLAYNMPVFASLLQDPMPVHFIFFRQKPSRKINSPISNPFNRQSQI